MKPPARLKHEARKKWLEVFNDFVPASPLDTEAACQYCEAWADYLQARKIVAAEGMVMRAGTNGAPYQHPALSTQNKAIDQMRRLYQSLAPLLKGGRKDADTPLEY